MSAENPQPPPVRLNVERCKELIETRISLMSVGDMRQLQEQIKCALELVEDCADFIRDCTYSEDDEHAQEMLQKLDEAGIE